MEYADFDWLMGVNFWGVVHGTKEFLPHLIASGDPQPCGSMEEGRRDDAVIGGRIGPRRYPGLEPLPEVEPAVPQELLVGAGLRDVMPTGPDVATAPPRGRRTHPPPHRRQPPAEGVEIAVVAPHLPRHEHGGIAPAGGAGRQILEDDPRRAIPAGWGMTVGTRPSGH